ncbi:hypothetical protein HDU93_009373, partial [Gonapodya sp. JEL0774]
MPPGPSPTGSEPFFVADPSVEGLGFQFAIAAVFWIAMILLFVFGRTYLTRVYAPRCELLRKDTPKFERNLFKLLQRLVFTSDEYIVRKLGLDALMYLRFLEMGFYMSIILAVLCVP